MRKSTILLLMSILLAASPAFAGSTTEDAADFLVMVGERALKGGNFTDAIHEFSKALMINPDNKKARAYLGQYGLEDGLYTTSRTKTQQMGEMAREIRDQRDMIASLEQERAHWQENVDVLTRGADHQALRDDHARTLYLDRDDRLQEKTIAVMEQLLEYREQYSEYAKDTLIEHKLALAQNRRELLDRTDRLKKLRKEYDAVKKPAEALEEGR